MRIAVDAMGGDHAPEHPVNGAVLAARDLGVNIALVGDEAVLAPILARLGSPSGIDIVHAEEAIGMDESVAVAVRKKRRSSIHEAARLLRLGDVQGLVSAGNTGAVMAITKVIVGTLEGVDRPALAVVLPTQTGRVIVLDVGANLEPKSRHLVQFAVMGTHFASEILGVERPRVGLLSIGEEIGKGNELVRTAHSTLQESSLNFIGNVEASDLYRGGADVVICDGFTGNILLKTSEAAVETLRVLMRSEFTRTWSGRLAGVLGRGAIRRLRSRVDYAEFGGAPLLGLRGLAVICHGRSNPRAIRNGVRVALEYGQHGVDKQIEAALAEMQSTPTATASSINGTT